MNNIQRFALEKYNGKNRFDCPQCNAPRTFARYVDLDSQITFAPHVGRCNREINCGYNFTPKQYFACNPNVKEQMFNRVQDVQHVQSVQSVQCVQSTRNVHGVHILETEQRNKIDYIEHETANRTLTDYENNNFVKFLRSIFDAQTVDAILSVYLLGTTQKGNVIFWQIDKSFKVRTGKIIGYDASSGKRQKFTSYVHAELIKQGKLKTFQLEQCFFGEHLITSNPHIKNICIVESEKTACICSAMRQDVIFLASSGLQNLQDAKFERIKDKRILFYPDTDKDGKAFQIWTKRAVELCELGFDIRVSNLLERCATDEQRESGYDLADYLIEHAKHRKNQRDIL